MRWNDREFVVGGRLWYACRISCVFMPRIPKASSMHAYLCKFKGRLKPEEMAEDIVFVKDPDAMLYREHVFRW